MRNRIVEANFKWRQAQMMVDYAHKQLDFAVGKWKDINEIDARYVNFIIYMYIKNNNTCVVVLIYHIYFFVAVVTEFFI